jgi:hypothetical protein
MVTISRSGKAFLPPRGLVCWHIVPPQVDLAFVRIFVMINSRQDAIFY